VESANLKCYVATGTALLKKVQLPVPCSMHMASSVHLFGGRASKSMIPRHFEMGEYMSKSKTKSMVSGKRSALGNSRLNLWTCVTRLVAPFPV